MPPPIVPSSEYYLMKYSCLLVKVIKRWLPNKQHLFLIINLKDKVLYDSEGTYNGTTNICILRVLQHEVFMPFGEGGAGLSFRVTSVSGCICCTESSGENRTLGPISLTDKSFSHVNINIRVCFHRHPSICC